jgi:hypothetical protein
MRRVIVKTTKLEPIGIGRTWDEALRDALRTIGRGEQP